jgi:hypothetical protein
VYETDEGEPVSEGHIECRNTRVLLRTVSRRGRAELARRENSSFGRSRSMERSVLPAERPSSEARAFPGRAELPSRAELARRETFLPTLSGTLRTELARRETFPPTLSGTLRTEPAWREKSCCSARIFFNLLRLIHFARVLSWLHWTRNSLLSFSNLLLQLSDSSNPPFPSSHVRLDVCRSQPRYQRRPRLTFWKQRRFWV